MEFVIQEEKQLWKVWSVMSLDTSLEKTNYDEFDPPIPNELLESNIDKIPYKWKASTVSSGRCSTANIMPLRPRQQIQYATKKKQSAYWQSFYKWYDYNDFE